MYLLLRFAIKKKYFVWLQYVIFEVMILCMIGIFIIDLQSDIVLIVRLYFYNPDKDGED